MSDFSVGQTVKCKSTTSMAAQLAKVKVGDLLVITHVKPSGTGTLLGLQKDGSQLYKHTPATFPSNDFEFVATDA